MTDLVSPEERLIGEKERFLRLVQQGVPQLHAAIDVGWTVTRWKHLMANRDFNELVQTAEEYVTDDVEMVLLQKAQGGNMEAIKMWLVNRRPDKWTDRREVKLVGEIQVAQVIIDGTRDGLRAMLEEHDRGAVIEALMPGGALDREVIEVDAGDDD